MSTSAAATGAPQTVRRRWMRNLSTRAPLWVALLVLAILTAARPSAVTRLDLMAYDLFAPSHRADAGAVVVLAIDDETLSSVGRWPWPRTVHAQVLDALREAGVATVGMNLLFTEADASPGADASLAQAALRHGGVVLALTPALGVDGAMTDGLPIAVLRDAAARLGHVDAEIDSDGQVRRRRAPPSGLGSGLARAGVTRGGTRSPARAARRRAPFCGRAGATRLAPRP